MTVLIDKDAERRKRPRRMRAVRPTAANRRKYIAALNAQADLLKAATANLSELFRSGASKAQVVERLTTLMQRTQAEIDRLAPVVARTFVDATDRENKAATEANLARAMGVNFAAILEDAPDLKASLDLATANNARLISSIGAEHWGKVAQAVLDNYAGKPLPGGSLAARLDQLGAITPRRATMIARDQTAKLTGSINAVRQEAIGVEEYTWRTAKDQRVVGNPNGLYPTGSEAHHDHYDREGKVFRWDSPPEGGHPGQEILCRCYAEPVVNIEKLKAKYV